MSTTDPKWQKAFAVVGELVLLWTALDHLLNEVLIEVFALAKTPMLEPIVATFDSARKIEMLKGYKRHIGIQEWEKGLDRYLDRM